MTYCQIIDLNGVKLHKLQTFVPDFVTLLNYHIIYKENTKLSIKSFSYIFLLTY